MNLFKIFAAIPEVGKKNSQKKGKEAQEPRPEINTEGWELITIRLPLQSIKQEEKQIECYVVRAGKEVYIGKTPEDAHNHYQEGDDIRKMRSFLNEQAVATCNVYIRDSRVVIETSDPDYWKESAQGTEERLLMEAKEREKVERRDALRRNITGNKSTIHQYFDKK